jgi:hypothetical protein
VLERHGFTGCGGSDHFWDHILGEPDTMKKAPNESALQIVRKRRKQEANKRGLLR